MAGNKFINMLNNKPPKTKTAIHTLIPGAKTRGDCAAECLILRNCQNLNKRLLSLVYVFRESLSHIQAFQYANNRRKAGGHEYENGYEQACYDINHNIVNRMLTREDTDLVSLMSIMNESYNYFKQAEQQHRGDATMIRNARALRIKYDRMYAQIQGTDNN
jgi:hypothetical protein